MSGSDIVRNFYANYFAEKSRTEARIRWAQKKVEHWRAKNKLAGSGLRRAFAEQDFHTALKKLDEDDQQIIEMRHTNKLTNRQVAKKLDITEPMASMRYLRAMSRLKKIISKE